MPELHRATNKRWLSILEDDAHAVSVCAFYGRPFAVQSEGHYQFRLLQCLNRCFRACTRVPIVLVC